MKTLFLALLALLIAGGYEASGDMIMRDVAAPLGLDTDRNTADSVEFVSIDPRTSAWFIKDTSNGPKKVFWEDLNNEGVNYNLPLERSFVSILREDKETGIGFASAKFTSSAGKYKVTLDYAKYRDENMTDKKNTPCRVGVGVRIIANVSTKKANLDLGSLFAISFAAKEGYLSGQIEVLKIGIDSPQLSFVLPPPSDINDSSLQNAMQAVAAIRAKLYDKDTKLMPHILAVQYQTAEVK
jgi:hypothetical protein